MKGLNYIMISLIVLCFGGAVFATSAPSNNMSPDINKIISYLNQAQAQEQAY